ncbi:hypothetical protein LCGC14_2958110 [marine sediment metagenome]|uniref:Uncharacterized protein n=1 Tax=marine sediment metagenome TaxID=412755 RepID=A0A0F8XDW1_9ZZZZ
MKLKSAYANMLGSPPVCAPRDFRAAASFLHKVEDAIRRGGWTRNEWRRLYGMRTKWTARANGTDERFRLAGNRRTGLTSRDTRHLTMVRHIRKIRRWQDEQESNARQGR